jgi:hypothetical protein
MIRTSGSANHENADRAVRVRLSRSPSQWSEESCERMDTVTAAGESPTTPVRTKAKTTLHSTHAGINDVFVGKASVVWYWHQGKWLELTGAN